MPCCSLGGDLWNMNSISLPNYVYLAGSLSRSHPFQDQTNLTFLVTTHEIFNPIIRSRNDSSFPPRLIFINPTKLGWRSRSRSPCLRLLLNLYFCLCPRRMLEYRAKYLKRGLRNEGGRLQNLKLRSWTCNYKLLCYPFLLTNQLSKL